MKTRFIVLIVFFCIVSFLYGQQKLVILHTNDTHSRIEPIPATDAKYAGMGGVVNRKAIIDSIRNVEKNVLLIDAGDIVQGTSYFNIFHGQAETDALNAMGYEVGTIGNHEFDNGLDAMKGLFDNLKYPIVNCNYDFSKTVLKGMIKPYVILTKGDIKIGVIGVGVEPEGLIQKSKYTGMTYRPTVERVNYYAQKIRNKCDVVICLSHIGIEDDRVLAGESKNIDLIIGGHSHTYMDEPEMIKNLDNRDVLVYQVGRNGAYIGKVELILKKKKND